MRWQHRIHSPLLATRTPLWRSRFLLVLVGLGFTGLLARAARLVTEITLGRGDGHHLESLDALALELATQGLAAAWPLGSTGL